MLLAKNNRTQGSQVATIHLDWHVAPNSGRLVALHGKSPATSSRLSVSVASGLVPSVPVWRVWRLEPIAGLRRSGYRSRSPRARNRYPCQSPRGRSARMWQAHIHLVPVGPGAHQASKQLGRCLRAEPDAELVGSLTSRVDRKSTRRFFRR